MIMERWEKILMWIVDLSLSTPLSSTDNPQPAIKSNTPNTRLIILISFYSYLCLAALSYQQA